MAEADVTPVYRTLCSHYSRGCSLLASNIVMHVARVTTERVTMSRHCAVVRYTRVAHAMMTLRTIRWTVNK